MKIGGLQKTSLLDYPDHISAIIWTMGCNFRCPFCYNKKIVFEELPIIPEKEVLDFLRKRNHVLEALVITGGEPTLQNDLPDFIRKVKDMGYLVKIDTNGINPTKINDLIQNNLVDYISMDVKAPKEKYEKLAGVKVDINKIESSIELIKNSPVDYEFRTTFVPTLLEKKDIVEIGKWLKNSKRYYIQQFEKNPPFISKSMEKVKPYSKEYMYETLNEIKSYFKYCDVRGV